MIKIGFIGAGKMAYALMKSMEKNAGVTGILMSDRNKERLEFIKKSSPAEITEDNKIVAENSDIVFLCVKPQHIEDVLKEIKTKVKDQIIISIAAGIKISSIQKILGKKRIVRVMPNTPCLVGEMAAGFSINKEVDEQDLNIIDGLLNSAGIAILMEEEKLDAVTGLSGSGPAFFARIIKHMAEAGVKEGLDEKTALKLAVQTAIGTGKLLADKEMKPDDLVDMVVSPNGTTVAGLKVLDSSDVDEVMMKTIKNAVKRSKELGKDE